MAKKLTFQKDIGGNNISIDQENREANLWSFDTFSDFGVFAIVYFDGNPYVNTTGVFTTTDPSQDTTNWRTFVAGSAGKIEDITEDTTTGIVTVSFTDSTPDLQVQSGSRIQELGGDPLQYRDSLNFIGNVDILDNNGNNRTDIYLEHLTNSSVGDQQPNTAGILVSGTLGGIDNKQPLATFRQLQGTTDEVTITSPDPTDPSAVNNPIVFSTPELKTGLDSLVGTSGSIKNITDLNISNLKNNDILEYDITSDTWENKDVPTGTAETLEQLIDVHIEDRSGGKTIISEIAEAFVDIEAASVTTELYGLDTTDGLLFVAPEGDTPINTVHLTVRRGESQDSIAYAVTSNELRVQSDFISSNPTLDNIYATVVEAFNDTNFVDGVRTIDGKDYHRIGDWTNPTNPRHVPGETATGSQTFTLKAIANFTDAVRMDFTILSPLGHFTRTILLTNVNYTPNDDASRTIALTNVVNQMVGGLNGNADFSNIYTASSNVGVLTITADAEGAASNGTFGFRILDTNDINGNRSSNTLPSFGQFNVNGGQDIIDSLTTLRWTNTGNSHLITKPTPFGGTTLYFKQGGFDWTDTDFAIRNLIDVAENTEEFPQMLIRPNAISDFNYTDVRIQNLDVINRAEKFKQGTLLQYAGGNMRWEYCGLADDGTVDSNNRVNFFKEPEENQFLVYNFRGGLDAQWTARFPLMSDVASLVNEEIGSLLISPDGTGFQAENATPGEFFVELGNLSNVASGAIPLLSPRFDSTYAYTVGNNFFTVRATGAYEFELAFTKSFFLSPSTGFQSGESVEFFVTKNGSASVVSGNDWAHPFGSSNNSLVAISPAFTIPVTGSVGTLGAVTPLIIDLNAGDTIQVRFSYINPGVIGVGMSNGPQDKSWMRARRVR